MKIDLAKISFEGEWFEFGDGGKLKIRPWPRSKSKFRLSEGAVIVDGMESKDTFKWCLMDWEGFENPTGEPIKLTEKVKDQIFESNFLGLAQFVIEKNNFLQGKMIEQEKN